MLKNKFLYLYLFVAINIYCHNLDISKTNIKNLTAPNTHGLEFGHIGDRYFSLDFDFNKYSVAYINSYSKKNNLTQIAYQLEDSKIYKQFIYSKIDELKLPRELFFIPMIEARFNPFSQSKKGAAGLWQFMLNSIAPYLKVNNSVDERKDFWLSTIAGLKKLKENYEFFNDWYLAIAGYNMGIYGLQKIIDKAGKKDFWYLYEKKLLPEQTSDYVLKFIAFSYIGSYPGRYGINSNWDDAFMWERVNIDYPINIKSLQNEIKIPDNILMKGNSEYNYGIADNILKIPSKYKQDIEYALTNKKNEVAGFRMYKIEKGDTLYDIAIKYDVSSNSIISYNNGIDPSRLKVGYVLKIPHADIDYNIYTSPKKNIVIGDNKYEDNLLKKHETKEELDLEEEIYSKILQENNDYDDIFMRGNFSIMHVVEKGDTLEKIAKMYGFTKEFILYWNLLKSTDKIKVGDKLYVPIVLFD